MNHRSRPNFHHKGILRIPFGVFFFSPDPTRKHKRTADSRESKDNLLLHCKLLQSCRFGSSLQTIPAKFHRMKQGHDDVLSITLLA